MIYSFYDKVIRVFLEDEEYDFLFQEAENKREIRVRGDWANGLRLSPVIGRHDYHSNYYTIQYYTLTPGSKGCVGIGWRSINGLQSFDRALPFRSRVQVKFTHEGDEPIINTPRLSEILATGASGQHKPLTRRKKVSKIRQPIVEPVEEPIEEEEEEEEQLVLPVAPRKRPRTYPSIDPSEQAEIDKKIEEIKASGIPSAEVIANLRSYADELSQILERNKTLFVVIKDNRLVLEEEVVDFEQF